MSLADSRHEPGSDRSHVSLINGLPAELLSSIFEWYMFPSDPASLSDYFPEEPLKISHVCKLWRETALDLPFMWRRILVETCQTEGRYLLAQLFLERTKDQTIAICYTEKLCSKDHQGKPCTAAIEFVIRYIGQTHTLMLEYINGETLSYLSKIPGDAASRLSCLVATVYAREQVSSPVTMQAALSPLYRVPSLRNLDWGLHTVDSEMLALIAKVIRSKIKKPVKSGKSKNFVARRWLTCGSLKRRKSAREVCTNA